MRPLRNITEDVTKEVPHGPLEAVGDGNAVGAVGYFTVSLINGLNPIDGFDVGFDIESHEIKRQGEKEMHIFKIHSTNRAVARYAGKFKSTPTRLNYITDDVEVMDVEKLKDRRGFSLWEVRTEVDAGGEETPEKSRV